MRPVIHLIVAARPNFIKAAPLYHTLIAQDWCNLCLVHTGQHYDPRMSDVFFHDLRLPAPDHNLNVGSGTHAEQVGGVMIAYEQLCQAATPDWIIVIGDVNSTLACALVGAKLSIRIAHLEAGLRSHDRRMPEEINRIVTDTISSLLWTATDLADANLQREGIAADRIERVGAITVDAYEMLRSRIESEALGLPDEFQKNGFGVITMHRPSNVDDPNCLATIFARLIKIAADVPLVFPLHPRTKRNAHNFGLLSMISSNSNILLEEPLGYIKFMALVSRARFMITDSGTTQDEVGYLGIPCLIVREHTERPWTMDDRSNRLIRPEELSPELVNSLRKVGGARITLWDGHASERAANSLRLRSIG
jgi:UDP-N-acetylglucosamine 2-epimerase (non-hydrolysing)